MFEFKTDKLSYTTRDPNKYIYDVYDKKNRENLPADLNNIKLEELNIKQKIKYVLLTKNYESFDLDWMNPEKIDKAFLSLSLRIFKKLNNDENVLKEVLKNDRLKEPEQWNNKIIYGFLFAILENPNDNETLNEFLKLHDVQNFKKWTPTLINNSIKNYNETRDLEVLENLFSIKGVQEFDKWEHVSLFEEILFIDFIEEIMKDNKSFQYALEINHMI